MSRALIRTSSSTLATRSPIPALARAPRGTGRIERIPPIVDVDPDREPLPPTVALAVSAPAPLPMRAAATYAVGPQRARDAYGPGSEPGALITIA